MALKPGLLMLTNGIQHIYCRVHPENGTVDLIRELPAYPFA
jgi:hypothetical protein